MNIEDRLEKLEKNNRRWQSLSLILISALAFFVLSGMAEKPADSISTKEIRLIDAEGTVRALLGTTDKGHVYLSLNDSFGNLRNQIYVAANGTPGLSFVGSNRKVRMAFSLDVKERPTLVFSDDKINRVSLTTVPPAIIFCNEKGTARSLLAVSNAGAGVLSVQDENGKAMVMKKQ